MVNTKFHRSLLTYHDGSDFWVPVWVNLWQHFSKPPRSSRVPLQLCLLKRTLSDEQAVLCAGACDDWGLTKSWNALKASSTSQCKPFDFFLMVLISHNYGNLSHWLWQVQMFFFIGRIVYFSLSLCSNFYSDSTVSLTKAVSHNHTIAWMLCCLELLWNSASL